MFGRKNEIDISNKLYNSNKSQFVAVYGRRRVGKTYLVNEVFKCICILLQNIKGDYNLAKEKISKSEFEAKINKSYIDLDYHIATKEEREVHV